VILLRAAAIWRAGETDAIFKMGGAAASASECKFIMSAPVANPRGGSSSAC
jgi:hypothetical protein